MSTHHNNPDYIKGEQDRTILTDPTDLETENLSLRMQNILLKKENTRLERIISDLRKALQVD